LIKWAQSFPNPPSVEATGARMDFPSYSPERRAIRLVVESSSIGVGLKPVKHCMNPVLELEGAPRELSSVAIDGKQLELDAYTWDGKTLWMKAAIGASGANIALRFR